MMAYKIKKLIVLCELIIIAMFFSFTHINSSFSKTSEGKSQKELAQAKDKKEEPEEEEEEDDDC